MRNAAGTNQFNARALTVFLACAALGIVLALAGALELDTLAALVLALMAAYAVAVVAHAVRRRGRLRERFDAASSPIGRASAAEFLAQPRDAADFAGAYVIRNATRQRVYAGGTALVRRALRRHLAGKGHETLYADFRAGDDLTLRAIALADSGYDTLDALVADVVFAYDAREVLDPLRQ